MGAPLMGRYNKNIDALLDDWVDWVHRGGNAGGFQSVLHKMMVTGCQTVSGGGSSPEIHTIEADIEAALFVLANTQPYDLNLLRVNVLRYEYGALSLGWPHDASQLDKAHRIGISLRTYRRHLKHCKDHLVTTLKLQHRSKTHDQ